MDASSLSEANVESKFLRIRVCSVVKKSSVDREIRDKVTWESAVKNSIGSLNNRSL